MVRSVDIFNNPSITGVDDKTNLQQIVTDLELAGCLIINSEKIRQAATKQKGTRVTYEYDLNKPLNKKRGVI